MDEVKLAGAANLVELEIETFEIEEMQYLDASIPSVNVSTSSTTSSTCA